MASVAVFAVGNMLYAILKVFGSAATALMVFSRFLVGVGSGKLLFMNLSCCKYIFIFLFLMPYLVSVPVLLQTNESLAWGRKQLGGIAISMYPFCLTFLFFSRL